MHEGRQGKTSDQLASLVVRVVVLAALVVVPSALQAEEVVEEEVVPSALQAEAVLVGSAPLGVEEAVSVPCAPK
eukprot:244218-Amphidinium_carterae.1